MEFWATLTGAAVGVLAGVFIQYFLTLLLNSRVTRAQKNALRKEFWPAPSLDDTLLS
jgi:hypothetical protein